MKILVIGESCDDVFKYGLADRMCPEAPVPVFIGTDSHANLGMAGNVFKNLQAIEKKIGSVGIANISIITKDVGEKTRYVDQNSNQMLLRVDNEQCIEPLDLNDKETIQQIREADAVVVSDYNKGFLNISSLESIAKESKLSFLDTKKKYDKRMSLFNFIKINKKEKIEGEFPTNGVNGSSIVMTDGSNGCYVNNLHHPAPAAADVRDVCGAGDTFLAAFAYHYTTKSSLDDAIAFAQTCASEVVSKKGVCTI